MSAPSLPLPYTGVWLVSDLIYRALGTFISDYEGTTEGDPDIADAIALRESVGVALKEFAP